MIEYKGYLGDVNFDSEAHFFHGEVINTRDVITFQGKSVDELGINSPTLTKYEYAFAGVCLRYNLMAGFSL